MGAISALPTLCSVRNVTTARPLLRLDTLMCLTRPKGVSSALMSSLVKALSTVQLTFTEMSRGVMRCRCRAAARSSPARICASSRPPRPSAAAMCAEPAMPSSALSMRDSSAIRPASESRRIVEARRAASLVAMERRRTPPAADRPAI